MKKKILICFSVAFIGVFLILGKMYLDYMNTHSTPNEKTLSSDIDAHNILSEVYGMTRMAMIMDKNNINYNKSINKELKTYTEYILKKISLEDISMEMLAKIVFCTTYLGIENKTYINAIDNYYYNGLIYSMDNIDEAALYDLTSSAASTTVYAYDLLELSNINLDDFPVKEQMIKYYNSAAASDDLSEFLYFFFQHGWLDEVDYMKQKAFFQNYYNNALTLVLDEKYSFSYAEIGSTYSFIEICKAMGIDTSELENWYKALEIPNDAEKLGLIPNNSSSFAHFMSAIYWHDLYYPETSLVTYPDYFFELFSKSFEEHYNSFLKPNLENILAK